MTGSVEETLITIIPNIQQNLNFLFLHSLLTLIRTVLLSHWESAELLFCCEELSFLPYKNKSQFWEEIFGVC
jgi:hypothetical protein